MTPASQPSNDSFFNAPVPVTPAPVTPEPITPEPVVGPSATELESPPSHTAGASQATPPKHGRPVDEDSIPPSRRKRKLKPLDRCVIWDVPFDSVTLNQAVNRIGALIERGTPSYVITANLNYVMLHAQESDVPELTDDADLILADGQPIVWRSRLCKQPLPERVAGSEMIYKLAQRGSEKGWSIYFLGGENGVAETCAHALANQYPGLKIAGIESPPFRALTEQEQAEQDARIQASGADILLVAFGQPKGERWIHQHYRRLGVPVSIQLGASFDFIAGTATRAPEIWQKIGMEWLYRMLSDPRRLIPRYAANGLFLTKALVNDWKRKVSAWGMSLDS